jgi:thiamine pyrophosphate-dependent acetolactate synthase large subunit-like protein
MTFRIRIGPLAQREIDDFAVCTSSYGEEFAVEQFARLADRMFEEMGCHGGHVVHVDRPEQFRPALERALHAGKTALINVIGDRRIGHPSLGGNLLGSTPV